MELYLDSANLKEIEEGFKLGFLSGLTTTPTFMQKEGITDVLKIDESIRFIQIEKLIQLKSERDNKAVAGALSSLKKAAQGTDNLMPFILLAVEKYATLGEISYTLREIFGEY